MNLRSTCQLTWINQPKSQYFLSYDGKDMAGLDCSFKSKTMKQILIMLFVMAMIPISSYANEDANYAIKSIQFFNEVQLLPDDTKKDFVVNYLLDEDGHPYIISIKSKNEMMNALVQKMFNAESYVQTGQHNGWFIITFLYEQIQ